MEIYVPANYSLNIVIFIMHFYLVHKFVYVKFLKFLSLN